ncbi:MULTISPECIES: succinate dehydrogenase assembly factor 2 [Gammaproteobacteria]|uniref:FAD assembly factor SdhE n=1 Tax=Gammaproteobacteria TaxID=1236 RepID=UPI0013D7FA80|nr:MULTISPECIES: succinate dehydrogenase assembly factor 2 [Gammaproteobacteria]MBO9479866.1 succinate dehydrogenase assembly factor 2 [Salinisphaera sp. G21_0]MBO9492636.1 succinate dehydrogenase assembly factor 2 [Thalassotalea sp. G20_0]WBA86604.1 succinate dehydrogenase assembly factor 2 [Endozoicomonas sp. GU-1]
MLGENELKCLQWRSRRGMLELDVLLEPFTREALSELSEADQLTYVRLLECEDPDLFSWFMSGTRPEDQALSRMVDRVLERGRYKGESL